MTRKGITGKILTIIMSLIIGIIALTLLWFFLSKSTDLITVGVQKVIEGIRCKLFCHQIFGAGIGMCSGC